MKSPLGLLLKSSSKMASATLLSRVLGLVREQVLAAQFGASGLTDAFTIAFRIPNMLRDLFAEGAFSSAFVPIFTQEKITDPTAARRLLWSLFLLLGIVTTFLSILMIIFAEPIILLVTDELFTKDPQRLQTTVHLIRVMSPFLVFISLAALFMGALNSLRIFFIPALAPALFNIVMITCMLTLPPVVVQWGFEPIFALGVGVLVGGFSQMAIQLPMLFKKAYGPIAPGKLISKASTRVIKRLGVGTIGVAGTQINILVTTMLATSTTIGAVSWLNYAFRLFQFPVGILGVSIANSNLVHFSDAWKEGSHEEARQTLHGGYLVSMLTMGLAMALLLGLAQESVHLVFERGQFNANDTRQSALALKAYVLGLPFYGLYKILAPTFFALDRPKLPVFISLFAIAFNIVFCLVLIPHLGFVTLALGTSVSMLVNCLLQAYFISPLLGVGLRFFLPVSLLKYAFAAVCCGLMSQWVAAQWFDVQAAFMIKIFFFCLAGLAGSACYVGLVLLLGEGKAFRKLLERR